ncbi:hypothetical protein [Alkalihalobacterium elongatum]|uniref:hypothetical protein n=1 Tax=Alkalihalobacterium elongatum TaxID=2675466 RepID=UPI001C1FF8AB|nr:hypothetical protein [Alkalihalobacterium elongatum]
MNSSHPWYVLSYAMSKESAILEDCLKQLQDIPEGGIAVLPEYVANSSDHSEIAFTKLKEVCIERKINVITTLNIIPNDLPHAEAGKNYNTLTIFTKEGRVHTPQAKITPQSFERKQYDEKFPAINVGDYDYLNLVDIDINGETKKALFVICSDMYTLMAGVESIKELKADICIVPGNFGNGAEQAVYRTLEKFRLAGIFETTIFANPYQNLKKPTHTPLVRLATDITSRDKNAETKMLSDWDRIQLVKNNVAIYPDDQVPSFVHMASLTTMDNGRMTIGMSRFAVDVKVDKYPEVIYF